MTSSRSYLRGLLLAPLLASCVGDIGEPPNVDDPPFVPGAPAFAPAPGTLRRLTSSQYRASIAEVIGPEIIIVTRLEPDRRPPYGNDENGNERGELLAIGAASNGLSASGVENYVNAAYEIAGQALANTTVHSRIVTCTPAGAVDDACVGEIVDSIGGRLFRRPVTPEERAGYVGVARQASTVLGTFDEGLEFALAAVLMSPNFIYRDELGDDVSTGERRLTPHQLATRLSFFLWAEPPDDELRSHADDGSLFDATVLDAQVARMLADDRVRSGVRAFFDDMLALYDLDKLSKSPVAFVQFTPDVRESAREETLLFLEEHIVTDHGDFRDVFTSPRTFVDRRLASIYNVPAPTLVGFDEIVYPSWMERRGLLGQVSFLALQSHADKTSAVLRGRFVRERLMCSKVPDPPPNLNTAIPPPTADNPTLRDRVFDHFQNPSCRGCHQMMDPIGLAFEHFDALGRFRTQEPFTDEAGQVTYHVISTEGSLAGLPYDDAAGLAQILHDHPDVPNCLVRTMYRYATGHVEITSETRQMRALEAAFRASGYDVLDLMHAMATSLGFQLAAPPVLDP